MLRLCWIALLSLTIYSSSALDSKDVVVVILSQESVFHTRLAHKLREDIFRQADRLRYETPIVRIVPEEIPHTGAWTVIPLLPRLNRLYGTNSSWIFFCEERTSVDLERLIKGLSSFNAKEETWLGYGLFDNEPSIIHHFAFAENPKQFKYPLFPSGFALSTVLIKSLVREEKKVDKPSEFSIDASHELAMKVGLKRPLRHIPDLFCVTHKSGCASYPQSPFSCGTPLTPEKIFFAVKTCHKFHESRIPVVKTTWGRTAPNIEFFSDAQNKSIPTTYVGVENTERGHCAKTMKILALVLERLKKLPGVEWIVLVDDDTIISVPRLQAHLPCFQKNYVIGERYGYNVKYNGGYNYITGGGGIVFGISTLASIVNWCHCPSIDTPDDMFLGLCLARIHLPVIHSPLFHQARPSDYSGDFLETQEPVSFHKHWMIDPVSVYNEWFSQLDHSFSHNEL